MTVGKADLGLDGKRLFHAMGDARPRRLQTDVGHGAAEQLPILRHVDGALRSADHFDVELLEHPFAHQVERGVERGLPAHGGEQRTRALLVDDALDRAPIDGLDVDRVRALRIGHDRGRVGVHQDDPITLFFQGLTRLSSRIIELTRLPDDDRPGADDEDALEVGTFRHRAWELARPPACSRRCGRRAVRRGAPAARFTIRYMKCSNNSFRSCGPGLASGCPES